MRTGAQTYKNVARQTANPRELEATLLLQAAAKLQSVHDSWYNEQTKLGDALMYNRKLWSVFLSDATDAKNPLPWMDQMLNAIEHTNFFENRATEYSKASTRGSWDEAFS